MGPEAIRALVRRVSGPEPSPGEQALVYDTLQYIAVSKRDFHQNHYLLTRELLERWRVPAEVRHSLPADYLERLAAAPSRAKAICRALVVSGFVLDGQLSSRESADSRPCSGSASCRTAPPTCAAVSRSSSGAVGCRWMGCRAERRDRQ
jgi:hypothetical protein